MTWLEFISQITSAIAWPAVAGGAVIVLRKQVQTLAIRLIDRVDDIRHLKAPGVDIEFSERVKDLAAAAGALQAADSQELLTSTRNTDTLLPPQTIDDWHRKYTKLAVEHPRAAVLLTFAELESLIAHKFRELRPGERPRQSFGKMLDALVDDRLITAPEYHWLQDFLELRNRAEHDLSAAISTSAAIGYVEAVQEVIGHFLRTGLFADFPIQRPDDQPA